MSMDQKTAREIAQVVLDLAEWSDLGCEVEAVNLENGDGWFVHILGDRWTACIHFDIYEPDGTERWNIKPIFHCAIDNLKDPLAIADMPVIRSFDIAGIMKGIESYFPPA